MSQKIPIQSKEIRGVLFLGILILAFLLCIDMTIALCYPTLADFWRECRFLAIMLPLIGIVCLILLNRSRSRLSITKTHVVGKTFRGKRIDLTPDMISDVVITSCCASIIIFTARQTFVFCWIENREEMRQAIRELMQPT